MSREVSDFDMVKAKTQKECSWGRVRSLAADQLRVQRYPMVIEKDYEWLSGGMPTVCSAVYSCAARPLGDVTPGQIVRTNASSLYILYISSGLYVDLGPEYPREMLWDQLTEVSLGSLYILPHSLLSSQGRTRKTCTW